MASCHYNQFNNSYGFAPGMFGLNIQVGNGVAPGNPFGGSLVPAFNPGFVLRNSGWAPQLNLSPTLPFGQPMYGQQFQQGFLAGLSLLSNGGVGLSGRACTPVTTPCQSTGGGSLRTQNQDMLLLLVLMMMMQNGDLFGEAEADMPSKARKTSDSAPDISGQKGSYPVKGRKTGHFGEKRKNRPAGYRHKGLDLAAPMGTAIQAPFGGRVLRTYNSATSGKTIEIESIRNGKRLVQKFFHLSNIGVRAGEIIEQNEVIGKVGSTGRSSGPHLHYETHIDGQAVDPEQILA